MHDMFWHTSPRRFHSLVTQMPVEKKRIWCIWWSRFSGATPEASCAWNPCLMRLCVLLVFAHGRSLASRTRVMGASCPLERPNTCQGDVSDPWCIVRIKKTEIVPFFDLLFIVFFPLPFSPLILPSPQQSPHWYPSPWVLSPFYSLTIFFWNTEIWVDSICHFCPVSKPLHTS